MDLCLPHFTYTKENFALLDSGADICIVCDDVLGVKLDKPQGVYFAFKYFSSPFTKSDLGASFIDIEGIQVDAVAKVVPRRSFPNNGVSVDIIIAQKVFFPIVAVLTQLPSMPSIV